MVKTINVNYRSNAEMLALLQEKSPAFISFAWTTHPECSCEIDLNLDGGETEEHLSAILVVMCKMPESLKAVVV